MNLSYLDPILPVFDDQNETIMKNYLTLHYRKLWLSVCSLTLVISLNVYYGDPKTFSDITWIDIFGESSALLLVLAFSWFIVHSRPLGRTSDFLSWGLIGFSCVMLQDLLDEFLILRQGYWFDDVFESLLAPLALISIAYGLVLWNKEQQAINQKLQNRERFYREHSALDCVTGLYTSLYMKEQLKRELVSYRVRQQPFTVALIDLKRFDRFNHLYGAEDGNRLLRHIANVINSNLRITDLACRYAGDRFIILFPDTHQIDATIYVTEVTQAIAAVAFKPSSASRSVFLECAYSLVDHTAGIHVDDIFQQLNQHLEDAKQKNNHREKVT